MSFVERILSRLSEAAGDPVLTESTVPEVRHARGGEILARVARARAFLRENGVRRGDRCVLVGANSIDWVACHLAILAEGAIVVPLYVRLPVEQMRDLLRDCEPAVVLCADRTTCGELAAGGAARPAVRTTAEALAMAAPANAEGAPAVALEDADPVALIYTSGTSGAAKGVILTAGNLDFMLARTCERFDQLLHGLEGRERIFHYLPFCFAGSWILLLSCLLRGTHLTLSTDLNRLPEEIRAARPHTMQNVPILLERMRAKVEQAIASKPAPIRGLHARAVRAYARIEAGHPAPLDRMWLALAGEVLFRTVRGKIGADLRALICGSAALAGDTQRFFQMIGLEVLQVYGLTETTAICTMDSPGAAHPDHVGRAIAGIEMRRDESGEILVRGPHVFGGYWRKPEETARAIRDGWFHTGDQGERLEDGCWKILGRTNHMIVLATGHNVSPEPIEERLLSSIPDAKQVVVVGHRRKHLAALITGSVATEQITRTLERLNPALAPYQRVHAFHVHPEPFTVESGMVTANGKLRREAILSRFDREIESLYAEAGR